ncbi:MAG: (2Fe-2S) ferredoxin domain-containing protein [Cyanobacteria bacterium P01_D01_bin.44]
MDCPQYRVFVCTKERSPNDPEGCCCNVGALDIYRAFQDEVKHLGLGDRVQIRKSGCLDHCEDGAVAMVYQPDRHKFDWLPTKLRTKLRRLLFPNRHLYGQLNPTDVSAIVESHLIKGQPLKRCQIPTQ